MGPGSLGRGSEGTTQSPGPSCGPLLRVARVPTSPSEGEDEGGGQPPPALSQDSGVGVGDSWGPCRISGHGGAPCGHPIPPPPRTPPAHRKAACQAPAHPSFTSSTPLPRCLPQPEGPLSPGPGQLPHDCPGPALQALVPRGSGGLAAMCGPQSLPTKCPCSPGNTSKAPSHRKPSQLSSCRSQPPPPWSERTLWVITFVVEAPQRYSSAAPQLPLSLHPAPTLCILKEVTCMHLTP